MKCQCQWMVQDLPFVISLPTTQPPIPHHFDQWIFYCENFRRGIFFSRFWWVQIFYFEKKSHQQKWNQTIDKNRFCRLSLNFVLLMSNCKGIVPSISSQGALCVIDAVTMQLQRIYRRILQFFQIQLRIVEMGWRKVVQQYFVGRTDCRANRIHFWADCWWWTDRSDCREESAT